MTARAGLVYFLAVFAVGFALGILRQMLVAPALGERWAELAEMPLMVAASWLAARWVVVRFRVGSAPGPRLSVGLIGLALLLAAELGVVLQLRGMGLREYVAGRDPVSGTVYLVSLSMFAAMPLLVGRRT